MSAKKESLKNGFQPSSRGMDTEAIQNSLANQLTYAIGKDANTATPRDWLNSVCLAVRDRLIERWMDTMRSYYQEDAKRVYYLSMEFLIGRSLTNGLLSLGILDETKQALHQLEQDMERLVDLEPDAALGNGGLGRLAACFLDSMATLQLPGYGYGIRYDYGMFTQKIEDGRQVEHPDNWLRYGNPWEFPRPEVIYPVRFGGRVVEYRNDRNSVRHHWVDTDEVMAMAFDTPIPGYSVGTVNNLRLWTAKATRDFDLSFFNEGDYIGAVEQKNHSENLSRVLYPDDTTDKGKELRLKQEYFFVSASVQDIVYRYKKHHSGFDDLPDKVAIQLNDTHPALAVPELMHILLDIYHLQWHKAWDICRRVFSYTNHTLLPEALETWPVTLMEKLLPRHLQIIYEINHHFLKEVNHHYPGDTDLLRRMSLVQEEPEKRIRMSHLAIAGSHKVNGVAEIHSNLMKDTIFADFYRCYPERFTNMTNGITPRLWLNQANPRLSQMISEHIGDDWRLDLDKLKQLLPYAKDKKCQDEFLEVKHQNKVDLANKIQMHMNIRVNPHSLFDVQIKRIHEYKRQLLNVLHIVTLYNRIRHHYDDDIVPRTVIIAGKAAPGYHLAKLIIKLINDIAEIINDDLAIRNKLKVVFIPNYDVSTATDIIPAADLSEQISTAGNEASGTGNMKLALNGALTIGTLDGANVEIREQVGDDNIFIFGHTVESLDKLQAEGYNPRDYYDAIPELKEVLDMIADGYFSPEEPDRFKPIVELLLNQGDHYRLLADYQSYIDTQRRVETLYQDRAGWAEKALINIAQMGFFSSDRTIRQYAEEIWNAKPVSPKKPT